MTAKVMLAAAGLVFLLVGGAAAAPDLPPSGPLPPATVQAESRDILAELIGVNTTHAMGTAAAARLVVARLKGAGFTDADLHVLTVTDHPGQDNVVVRLRGKGRARPILYECHLDVVEAKPEDWSLPPFKMTEQDGYFYGRGAIDMKDEDTAVLVSLLRLKREGFVPDRDIIVAFTTDEEGGDANGVDWLMKTHRDKVDAEFAINAEDGGGAIDAGKRLGYGVQTSEKSYVTYQIEVTNPGGHSSQPEPDNAIYRLATGLLKVQALQFPVKLNDTTRGFFTAQATHQTGQMAADMTSVGSGAPDPAALKRLEADPHWSPYLRTTCVATMAQAGHAENALPQRAAAIIQCRMIPGDTQDVTLDLIRSGLDDPQVKLSVISPAEAEPESPLPPTLMKTVKAVVGEMWPGVAVFPSMDVGASDALFSRIAGVPTYGLDGMFYDVDDNRAHGRDERTAIQSFYEDVEFNYRLMKAISRAP
jgi:acetylornithine deacetylase/succinyl-diaminopimelate desuccinylase-like protein